MSKSLVFDEKDIENTKVSAVQLALLADLRPENIHYWAQKAYIRHESNGSKTPFFLSDLPRVRLLKQLTEEFEMEASRAAPFLDELLEMYENEPRAYKAAMNYLSLFKQGIGALARLLSKLGFSEAVEKKEEYADHESAQTTEENKEERVTS